MRLCLLILDPFSAPPDIAGKVLPHLLLHLPEKSTVRRSLGLEGRVAIMEGVLGTHIKSIRHRLDRWDVYELHDLSQRFDICTAWLLGC